MSQIWQQQREIFEKVSTDVGKQLKRHNRYIVDPRTCQWLFAWDLCSFVCLGFTAICTPIEVQTPCRPAVLLGGWPASHY